MSSKLQIEISIIVILHIIAISISVVALVILYMKSNKTKSLKAFIIVQSTMIAWMIFKIFKTVAPTVEIRWWAIVSYYGAICLLEATFLEFGYIYYKGKLFNNKIRVLVYIIPIIQFIVVVTNPLHHLFYKTYDFYRDTFGILFYVHLGIEYIYILIGAVYCSFKFKKLLKHTSKIYRSLVAIAILTPVLFNIIYISGAFRDIIYALNLLVIFDITPMAFTISLLIFVYITFKYEFFNLSPIMEHEIIYEIDTPICVLNDNYEIVFVNEKLKKIFNNNCKKELKKIVKSNGLFSKDLDLKKEFWYKERCFLIFKKIIRLKSSKQFLITFDEITSYKEVEKEIINKRNELDIANIKLNETINILKETSKEVARNYVARELHDIIGHSLVVTSKLLEVAQLYYKKDMEMTLTSLEDASLSIETGILQMKQVHEKVYEIDDEALYKPGSLLEKEMENMLDYIKNIGIDATLVFKGGRNKIKINIFEIIKKICIELVTNSLKHSNASKLLVSITITKLSISILIIDNGKGCENIVPGNGLKGIYNRLVPVNGTIKYGSSKSEGLSTSIFIPQ